MNVTKIGYLIACYVAFSGNVKGQEERTFIVKGQLSNTEKQFVFLRNNGMFIDSCLTDSCGYFTLKGRNTEEQLYSVIYKIPRVAKIDLALYDQTISLLMDPKGRDNWLPFRYFKIDGSPSTYNLNFKQKIIDNSFAEQFKKIRNSQNTLGSAIEIQSDLNLLRMEWYDVDKKVLDTTSSAAVAFVTLAGMDVIVDLLPKNENIRNDFDTVYNRASEKFSNSSMIQGLHSAHIRRKTETKISPHLVNINDQHFSLRDNYGNLVHSKEFSGKYVLLDFWASWCKPCRQESVYLKTAFKKFRSNNFMIVSISLDTEKQSQKWIDAINQDGIGEWVNLINDAKDNVITKFGIYGIPYNMFIGPDGKILASNLRGEALIGNIERLMGK